MCNFKTARKSKKLTQEEVSELLNVSQRAVSSWETGVKEPNIATIIKLSDIYEVTIDYLLDHVKGRQDASSAKDAAEIELLRSYRSLSPQGQEYVRQQMYMATQIYKNNDRLPGVETERIS